METFDLSQRGMTLIDFGWKLLSSVDNKGNKRQVKIVAKVSRYRLQLDGYPRQLTRCFAFVPALFF